MEHARPPSELVLKGSPTERAETWRKWLRQFQVFVKASGVYKEPSDVQTSFLINLIGSEGYDVYSTFKFKKDEDPVDDVVHIPNEEETPPHTTEHTVICTNMPKPSGMDRIERRAAQEAKIKLQMFKE